MPRVVSSPPSHRTTVRRRDRAVDDDAWIRALLHRAPVGSLAMAGADNQPFLNLNLFAYDEARAAIYMHTARLSSTRAAVEDNSRVCFGVMEMGRLLPADRAKNFSVEYASVVVFGRGRIVEDSSEAEYALQCLMTKYAPHLQPGLDYQPSSDEERLITSVYCITIEEWSGKTKVAPDDFPGVFRYSNGATA
jgi:nitroimidazol reductase NimA-like FMN-containing flavoprotein (pyridoxamine 5'-phosphate oxidase superfamily)